MIEVAAAPRVAQPASQPLVSVIIPVYQGEHLVAGAVRSALNQTHANLDVIVVDDGSTDRTFEVVREIGDTRLTVLRQPNAGTAAARNYALSHARGSYIAFLDCDDRWFPRKIERELRTLQAAANPVGVAYSGYYAVDDAGRLLNPAPLRRMSGNLLDALLDGEDFLIPSACLFDRRVLETVGGFRQQRFHEDYDLMLRVAKSFAIYATGDYFVVYRQSTSGKCRGILADFERARDEELSLVLDVASELDPDQLERLRKNVLRGLYCRFLMYGFDDHARRLAGEVDFRSMRGGKKAVLARVSQRSGINLLIAARLTVQWSYRALGQRAWQRQLAQSCVELDYGMRATTRPATASDAEPARVCIAVPTLRRPQQLASVLTGIAAQQLEGAPEVEVVVIDNDVRPSAASIVDVAAATFPFALRYDHVPEPGLSNVRNRALMHARERFDYLAMIDDDEIPQSNWLRELLRVQQRTVADVVIGPVPKTYTVEPPGWIRRGRFFDLPRYADGAPIEDGYSGNCLLRVAALRQYGVTFDRELNLAGGEDLFFFRQLRARGASMAYAARAVAFETFGPERLSWSYLTKLNFRRGNSLAFCDRRLAGTPRATFVRVCKGTARIVLGLTTLAPLTLMRGKSGAATATCNVAQGLGSLVGAFGVVYLGYRRGRVR